MAHKKIIDSVKKQGQVAIKDLDEFLRFIINESDMRTYDDNYISILIPMKFDIDKVFELDVCKRSDDDYVILYSCWYPNKDVFGRQFEMRLYHYDNSNDDGDLGLDIVMTQSQYDAVLQRFEEQYNAIVQKYDEKTVQQFAVLTAITMTALLENPEQDFLGTVYHNLGLSKSQAGQFFTPYNVGQMMARMSMPDSFVLDKSRVWRVNDPCCGAGCLLLAGYNAMREQLESTDPDWDKYVLFVAQDIDPLACKMCYIQMCCIGVPGVVVAGNSLFPDAEREPTDFWFTHKYFALDEKAFENAYQQTKE